MARRYIKLFFDFVTMTQALTDAEVGRLVKNMLAYSETGIVPRSDGAEQYLFPLFKAQLDRDTTVYETKMKQASNGGKTKAKLSEGLAKLSEGLAKPSEGLAKPAKNKELRTKELKNKEQRTKELKNKDLRPQSLPLIDTTEVSNEYLNTERDGGDGDGELIFGLTDTDIKASLERDALLEDTANQCGLPCNEVALVTARRYADEYPMEWLLEAMRRTAQAGKGWGYVAGILRNWKQKGGMDDASKHRTTGKTVTAQQYTQREYSESDFDAIGEDLMEEARNARA